MYTVIVVRDDIAYDGENTHTIGTWDCIEDARKAGEIALYYNDKGKEARIYHCLNCIEINKRDTWKSIVKGE